MRGILRTIAALAVAIAWCGSLNAATTPIPAGTLRDSPYRGAIAVEASTGRVLFADQADRKGCPASVTKLMTTLVVLDAVKAGKLALTEKVAATPTRTSDETWYRQPSCIGLAAGEELTVEEYLRFLLVKSANDAAVILAERVAGNLDAFVQQMNDRAASLGMTQTHFVNPNGLPPPPRKTKIGYNISTAADLAKLSCAVLKEYPEVLKWTSVKFFDAQVPVTLPGKRREWVTTRVVNHNNVMVKDKLKIHNPDGSEAVDGLKTGFIQYGGSSVALTGHRGDKRVVVVVLGSNSSDERDAQARHLLSDALDALGM